MEHEIKHEIENLFKIEVEYSQKLLKIGKFEGDDFISALHDLSQQLREASSVLKISVL